MSHAVQSGRAAASPSRSAWFPVGLPSALRALWRDLAGAWRYAVARREFNGLDERTLRDLGMSRAEFDSYWAETHGLAEQTRVRVMQHVRSRYGL